MPSNEHVLDHPLVQHKLTLLRKQGDQHHAVSAACCTRSAR